MMRKRQIVRAADSKTRNTVTPSLVPIVHAQMDFSMLYTLKCTNGGFGRCAHPCDSFSLYRYAFGKYMSKCTHTHFYDPNNTFADEARISTEDKSSAMLFMALCTSEDEILRDPIGVVCARLLLYTLLSLYLSLSHLCPKRQTLTELYVR